VPHLDCYPDKCFREGFCGFQSRFLSDLFQYLADVGHLLETARVPCFPAMYEQANELGLLLGYAEATAEASVHGRHHTGDIGYLDVDNFLYIVDRAKDMIITGGFNVYSVEVENALQAHETIQDCAVIGLPDEKWGERVVAVVQPRAGRTVDVAAVSGSGASKRPSRLKSGTTFRAPRSARC
jgi:acyl-CoA synthetase (AMP-forming)/AMP-acid ligase II